MKHPRPAILTPPNGSAESPEPADASIDSSWQSNCSIRRGRKQCQFFADGGHCSQIAAKMSQWWTWPILHICRFGLTNAPNGTAISLGESTRSSSRTDPAANPLREWTMHRATALPRSTATCSASSCRTAGISAERLSGPAVRPADRILDTCTRRAAWGLRDYQRSSGRRSISFTTMACRTPSGVASMAAICAAGVSAALTAAAACSAAVTALPVNVPTE